MSYTNRVLLPLIECEAPNDVPGAELREEYSSKTSFNHGDQIEYRCDKRHRGEFQDGHSWKRSCFNGQWSEVKFRCTGRALFYIF